MTFNDEDDGDDGDNNDDNDVDDDALNRIFGKWVDMYVWNVGSFVECKSRVFVEINGITFWCKSSAETVFQIFRFFINFVVKF